MKNSSMLRWIVGGAVLALAAWSPRASASAFQLAEQNGSGLGNAYSGQAAVAEDASTIFWNPAGMTLIPDRQVTLEQPWSVRPRNSRMADRSRGRFPARASAATAEIPEA